MPHDIQAPQTQRSSKAASGDNASEKTLHKERMQTRLNYCPRRRCQAQFKRKSDLQRHINAKHNRTKSFVCPAQGCFKKQNRRISPRADKLKSHLHAMHDAATLVKCPENGCRDASISLVELKLHLNKCHPHSAIQSGIPNWYCPIKPCRISKTHNFDLHDHIYEHCRRDEMVNLEMNVQPLLEHHFKLIKSACFHKSSRGAGIQSTHCSCTNTGVEIICPVCKTSCKDKAAFQRHMEDLHLVDPSQQNHFDAWKNYCMGFQRNALFDTYGPFDPTTSFWVLYDDQVKTFTCPSCNWSRTSNPYCTLVDHHNSMWRTEITDLKSHRGAILALLPHCGSYFGLSSKACWKPLFADLIEPRCASSNGDAADNIFTN